MAEFAPEVLDLLRSQSGGIGGLGHWTKFHVRKAEDGGSDSHNGESWAKAFATIQTGLDAVGALAKRGKGIVLVGPGYYTETLLTPLNAVAPFGMLLGVSPTNVSMGAVCIASEAGDDDVLTVRARGWRIAGIEFECPAEAAGVKLQKDWDPTVINAALTEVDHCHFTSGFMGINNHGSPERIHIHDNEFDFITAGDNGLAIGSTFGAVTANLWQIIDNIFNINTAHIRFTGGVGALKSSLIAGNIFLPVITTGAKIWLVEANAANVITRNHFSGEYSKAPGGYGGGTTDEWWGNYANVDGGITRIAPA